MAYNCMVHSSICGAVALAAWRRQRRRESTEGSIGRMRSWSASEALSSSSVSVLAWAAATSALSTRARLAARSIRPISSNTSNLLSGVEEAVI